MMDIFGLQGSYLHGPKGESHHEEAHNRKVFPVPFYVDEKGFDSRYYPCDVAYRNQAFKQRWEKCAKGYHRMFPSLFRVDTHQTGDILRSGNWLKGEDQEWRGFRSIDDATFKNETATDTTNHGQPYSQTNEMPHGASFVRVPTAVAGIGKLGQLGCDGDCMIGRASQFYSFREFLLGNILWPDYNSIQHQKKAEGPAGYVTFSLPVGSSRPKEVSFFENMIPVARTLYGEDKVKVVDMAKLSAREEAMMALDTAVLFANHGGGSATSIFLSRDSSVFLYTAGSCTRKPNVWCDEGKNHFDSIFYNSNGYVRQQWIEVGDRNNTEKIKTLLQSEYTQTMNSWGLTTRTKKDKG